MVSSTDVISSTGIIASTHAASVAKKLRVLVVCHAYVTNVNQGKLAAIAATGAANVALLAPSYWQAMDWDRKMALEQVYADVQIYPADIKFSGRAGAYFYWPWKIWQVIQDFKPDVIHVEQEVFSVSAMEMAVFAKLFGKPMSVFGWENMERQLSPFRQWIRQTVFNNTQLIIPGNKDGEQLTRQWGYQGKIEIMPQIGVDTELFPPRVRQLGDAPFNIGFMGRLVPQKGVDTLLIAAKILRDRNQNVRVTICGSGSESDALHQIASEQDLDDIVDWKTDVSHSQVPEAMDEFDALVLPSRTIATWKEQFGHVLIESMSMGIPTVGTDSGEIPNVIGNTELVFPEDDAEALAEILERMVGDTTWYSALSQASIDRVNQLYSHERIAQRLIALWREL